MTLWRVLLAAFASGTRSGQAGRRLAIYKAAELLEDLEEYIRPEHMPAARLEAARAKERR